MNETFDLAIVGSGFGGSIMAMVARQLGCSVVLLERGSHPRHVIGESSTPLANLLLEEIAAEFNLPELASFSKWGTWQRDHPEIGCGLKRGFTFLAHELGRTFPKTDARKEQLLVAASPNDRIADTHWFRPDFDQHLMRQAVERGAVYLDRIALDAPVFHDDGVEVIGVRDGQRIAVKCRCLLDASGPRGYLSRALALEEEQFRYLPATQALFSWFEGVGRVAEQIPKAFEGGPPYPPDAAAIHHVFDGGWIWVLHFNNGITSAGVAATDRVAAEFGFSEGEPAWRRLLDELPTVRNLFAGAKPIQPFRHIPRIGSLSRQVCGERWALLPSAAGFVDPLLSTGFTLNLRGIQRLGRWLKERSGEAWSPPAEYAVDTRGNLLAAERMVGALYANMHCFPVFASVAMLYFASVSFAETARRLGRAELAPGFLLRGHAEHAAAIRRCCERAMELGRRSEVNKAEAAEFERMVLESVEPFNIAGIGRHGRSNWHPVDAEDLFRSAHKLGVGRAEIEGLLKRCGF